MIKRGVGGFSSSGVSEIEQILLLKNKENVLMSVFQISNFSKAGILQIVENLKDHVQIIEEAIIKLDTDVVVHEKVTID